MAFGVEGLADALVQQAVGHVVHALGALVLDRVALDFELLLGHRVEQEAHAVGLQPEQLLQLVGGRAVWK